ncbi:MAG: cytochrome b5-like heme/steroid binding domain-containing protein [Candidatus Paceibacterota bacterium]
MNRNIIISVVILIVLAGGIIFTISSNGNDKQNPSAPTSTTAPTSTPAPTTQTASSFTMAQVQTHNSKTDCWSAINGKVYNLTSWIGQHPGGQGAILSICGKDGSPAFNDQHGGQSRPANELDGFFIGVLIN